MLPPYIMVFVVVALAHNHDQEEKGDEDKELTKRTAMCQESKFILFIAKFQFFRYKKFAGFCLRWIMLIRYHVETKSSRSRKSQLIQLVVRIKYLALI